MGRVAELGVTAHMASRRISWYWVFRVIWWGMVAYAIITQLQSSRSWWLTIFLVACAVGWAVHAFRTHRRERGEMAQLDDWYRRLEAVVDVRDFDDDGHFHEYFELADRERLIQELELPAARAMVDA